MRPRHATTAFVLALATLGSGALRAETRVAERPPMGWNCWNSFGVTVNEAQVKANADYMAKHLKRFGWEYVVVDLGWYLPPEIDTSTFKMKSPPQEMDARGRLLPHPGKFPSAVGGLGFKPLADYVHGLGLKFGIHIMRGIPWQAHRDGVVVEGTTIAARSVMDQGRVCPWYHGLVGLDTNRRGGQEYYDSLVALYARWGVDYIKADDMSQPYDTGEIEALAAAIRKAPRPIVLSLSPGATPIEKAEHVKSHANLWRISPDFWDLWKLLDRQFELCRQWQPHVGPGHWPDADMLPLGKLRISPDDYVAEQMGLATKDITNEYSRFTTPEKYTLVTLWSIFRSPLMIGGHLPENDALTLQLLTNEEVLAVDQASSRNREVLAEGKAVAWAADAPDGGTYLALFNRGETPLPVEVPLAKLGLPGTVAVRDLWKRAERGTASGAVRSDVEPHGAVLLKLSPPR
jgi:alpha-galactosidase